jgi:hypothetical protein
MKDTRRIVRFRRKVKQIEAHAKNVELSFRSSSSRSLDGFIFSESDCTCSPRSLPRSNEPCAEQCGRDIKHDANYACTMRLVRALFARCCASSRSRRMRACTCNASAFRGAIMLGEFPPFPEQQGYADTPAGYTRIRAFTTILRCTMSTSPLQTATAPGRVNVAAIPGERVDSREGSARHRAALPHSQRRVSD